ncbi:protein of unknown function DUF140 [Desulfovibrio sp. X2]|uniref:MlaE family ABC transporter permease n=1 Tax=Desulfovibrio sp. X2 TaxID=941449 RepID=UPI0003587DCB|nr:ABC transporter permease [Desulfovibrio sp. X2]EPR44752.1 protein of unknown function DUF140 [Desulfovibrio sp. X2]
MLTAPIAWLGRQGLSFVTESGRYVCFSVRACAAMFRLPLQFVRSTEQVYFVGVRSMSVILLIGLFTGMVLGLQGYYALVKFGSEGMLGAAVALSLIRELGPVLTAIMVIGRAGSAMTAEIGVMRISEQIDALDTMDIDPVRYLVSPKVAGSILCFPLLTAFFDVVGIIGGYLTGVVLLGVNSGVYWYRIQSAVELRDVSGGFVKSLIFALIVATMCSYQGYYTHLRSRGFGAVGVSLSTTTAVVISCVMVLVSDYVITTFFM